MSKIRSKTCVMYSKKILHYSSINILVMLSHFSHKTISFVNIEIKVIIQLIAPNIQIFGIRCAVTLTSIDITSQNLESKILKKKLL